MKTFSTLVIVGLAISATGSVKVAPKISVIGNLVRTNSHGDSRYANTSDFIHSGTHGYISDFARMLSGNSRDYGHYYRDVMVQGVTTWEDEVRPKGFANDLAGALAYFTVVNVGIAKGEGYKFHLLPNLVSQYRKALSAKVVGQMSDTKKQDLYDYLLAESVYIQTITASNPSMSAEETTKWRNIAAANVENAFGVDASRLNISENGLDIG